jgi:NADH-quinone oxidoreductase subunit H
MDLADLLIIALRCLFIWIVPLVFLIILIWFERKGSSFIQDRTGPNRAAIGGVRLAGIVHLIADVVKLLMKEMMIPGKVNRFYFMVAPFIGFTFVLLSFAVIPWADVFVVAGREIPMQVAALNAGVLFILAITSLEVYGAVLAGWSSNNKFALLGGLRSTAQMISYEIPLGLAIVGVFMAFQSAQLNDIVRGQGELLWGFLPKWGVFIQPLGFIIFLTAIFAETNRNPFDLPEGESEIVAGFHTEYSGMRFALFYMTEYAAIVLSSAMIATLYFGGWQVPWMPTDKLIANAEVVRKVLLLVMCVGAAVFAWWMFVFAKRVKGKFGDAREKEGIILGVPCAIAAAVLLFFFFRSFAAPISDTGARVVVLVTQILMFLIKLTFFCWFFIWVRWSLPRFRYDQLMRLGWKTLIPLSFINIFATGLIILLVNRGG